MKYVTFFAVACACLILATCGSVLAGKATAPDEAKKSEEHYWFSILVDETRVGHAHIREETIKYKGRNVCHTVESGQMSLMPGRVVVTMTLQGEVWHELDGRLIKAKQTEETGNNLNPEQSEKKIESLEVKNGKLTAAKTVNGETQTKELDIPKGVKVYAREVPIKVVPFEPGKSHEYTVFSFDTMKLEKERYTGVERRKMEHGGKKIDALVFNYAVTDMPQMVMQLVVSPDRKLLHASAAPVEIRRTTKKEALKPLDAPVDK